MSIFYNWITLAVLAGLASTAFNFFNRYILKDKDDSTMYAWYQESLKVIIFGSIAFFDWKFILTDTSIIIFILLGLTEWIAVYLYMKMHYFAHLSISSIISRTRMIWVAVIAFILLGERLEIPEYIGILILFFGLSIVVAPNKLFVDKGAMYANLAAFMIALNTVIIKMALPYASISVINIIMVLPAALFFPMLVKDFRKKASVTLRTNLKLKSLNTFISVASLYLLTMALGLGDSSKVMAIYQGMLIFSVLAGIIFLKERENAGRKIVGAIITIIGVIMLTT